MGKISLSQKLDNKDRCDFKINHNIIEVTSFNLTSHITYNNKLLIKQKLAEQHGFKFFIVKSLAEAKQLLDKI